MSTAAPVDSVILVHGGFVDGSGWQTVYNILTKDGYSVRVAQHPTVSLAGDVAATRQLVGSSLARSSSSAIHAAAPGRVMADSQVPWGQDALAGTVSQAAWRAKQSWYLETTEDRMISPQAQRAMAQRAGSTVTEVAASHSVFLSQPAVVADLIRQATAGSGSGRPLARVR